MDKKNIEKRIVGQYSLFLGGMPPTLRKSLLLTGGSAAFLYGSDRPFSDDIDFMVSFEKWKAVEKATGVSFAYRKKKPIFHSLAATVIVGKTSFDLMAETVIQPIAKGKSFAFRSTPWMRRKRVLFQIAGHEIACLPKEVLVATKLLAGRGQEVGKYDLYDVKAIVEKNRDFDFATLKKTVRNFCKPLKSSVPILIRNTEKILAETPRSKTIQALLKTLGSLQ